MEGQPGVVGEEISEAFGLLPEPQRRAGSFAQSMAVNIAIGGLLLWWSIARLHKASPPSRYVNQLVFLKPRAIPPVSVRVQPSMLKQIRPSKIAILRPPRLLPKPDVGAENVPAMPAIPFPQAKQVVAEPQPTIGMFAAAKVVTPANNKNTIYVTRGGFGDPSGVADNPNANRASTIITMGSFNNAAGANQGAGAHAGSNGTIKSGGFGSGVNANSQSGVDRGANTNAGFGSATAGAGKVPPAAPLQSMMTPPQVLSEPRPQYTEEAKQLRIQGEITLQVRFGINGQVEVLRIVNSLGHGLDEEAKRVAEQIQFKPATKNGHPSDNITYIHILFQLA